MAKFKKNDLKKMPEAQLKEKMIELKKELMKINTQKSSGASLENPGRVRVIRKTVATILMLQSQKKNQNKLRRD